MVWSVKEVFFLVSLSISSVSNYALVCSPGSLQRIMTGVLQLNNLQYGIIFSLCSWASLLDVLHGYLLDRYLSATLATVLYCFLLVGGCICYAIGGFNKDYWMLISGRILLGFGLNPLMLLSTKQAIAFYHEGGCMNFVFAVGESVFWLGSAVVYFTAVHTVKLTEKIYHDIDTIFAIANSTEMAIFGTCLTISSIVLNVLYGQKIEKKISMEGDLKSDGLTHTLNSSETPNFNVRNYIYLPPIFWIFSFTTFIYYSVITSFISMSQIFFEYKYGVSISYAGVMSGIITLIASILSPLFSFFLDKYGHNLTSFTSAIVVNLGAVAIFAFTAWNPLISVILMGISIMLSTSLWAQFQYLASDHQTMLAYGIANTGLHTFQAVGNIISGILVDKYGYDGFLVWLFFISLSTVPSIGVVWFLDYRRGPILNLNTQNKNSKLGRIEEQKTKI